jgi:hypothetical protein
MNAQALIDAWIEIFRRQKTAAERAIEQLPDDALHDKVHPSVNTVATIVKHMAGNMRSRWTDWLTTDGEKPDRDRDDEFVDTLATRDDIMARWEEGWACVFNALGDLTPDDLDRTVTIRAEPHSVPTAVNRQIDHYAYHVGQIVTFCKILATRHGVDWQHLSVAPGASKQFNEAMRKRHGDF